MATLDEPERRVADIEPDIAEIPKLVTMNFDLLKVEMRAMERRIEVRLRTTDDKIDAGFRAIAELIAEQERKT